MLASQEGAASNTNTLSDTCEHLEQTGPEADVLLLFPLCEAV